MGESEHRSGIKGAVAYLRNVGLNDRELQALETLETEIERGWAEIERLRAMSFEHGITCPCDGFDLSRYGVQECAKCGVSEREHPAPARLTREEVPAARELQHLREQRDRLHVRCNALLEESRALRGVVRLRWKRMGDHALPMPRRARPTEAGHDLAVIVEPSMRAPGVGVPEAPAGEPCTITVYPGTLVHFRTGWAVEIPLTHEGVLKPRSSTGRARWFLATSGVIDPTYRGEVTLPMLYLGEQPYKIRHGDRMAQMLLVPRPLVEDEDVGDAELSPSERGDGAYGSTGR